MHGALKCLNIYLYNLGLSCRDIDPHPEDLCLLLPLYRIATLSNQARCNLSFFSICADEAIATDDDLRSVCRVLSDTPYLFRVLQVNAHGISWKLCGDC